MIGESCQVTSALPPHLVELARAKGVGTDYWDWQGQHTFIPEGALREVLTALGEDVSSDESIHAALHRAQTQPWRRTLPATVVSRQGYGHRVLTHVAHGSAVEIVAVLDDGTERALPQVDHLVAPQEVDGTLLGEAAFEVPADLPLGYHRLVARTEAPPLLPETAQAHLIVVPNALTLPDALTHGPIEGLMTQIYQVRSRDSWGFGDLGDLRRIGEWAARDRGFDFLLVNPLHAAEPVPHVEPSPYLPTSRRFGNPLYIDLETIPGIERLDAQSRIRVAGLAGQARPLNTADTIDRDAGWTLKREALEVIYAALAASQEDEVAAYAAREGQALTDFATWCSLAQDYGPLWDTDWPEPLRDVTSEAVVAHRADHPERIGFYIWLQWVLDGQLGSVQRGLVGAGMSLGVIHDLAVGIHPEGADAWALTDVLAKGVTVGAPADQFNQLGQNWSQPPWRPDRLAEAGYAPFRDMVRSVLRDSGGVRVDHIIGLFRLWWVPEGHIAADGAYVHYDHEAMVGILALEAHRAQAVVIGEDLGVVEPWVRDYLRERGILGTSIVWFEWAEDGRPRPPETYRELCLATVTTHDLPPTAGYLALEHVALRERLGLLTRSVEEERAAELAVVHSVREALMAAGLLAEGGDDAAVVEALHAWLRRTPSLLHGIALTDLVGDVRVINQPGTDEEYPNWRVPIAGPDRRPLLVEDIVGDH